MFAVSKSMPYQNLFFILRDGGWGLPFQVKGKQGLKFDGLVFKELILMVIRPNSDSIVIKFSSKGT